MQSKEDREVVLSEEEMKKMKEILEYRDIERLKGLCKNKGIQRFEGKQLIALENLIKDYEQLKSREQKLTEKLEKDIAKYPESRYTKWYLVDCLIILKGENDE